MFFNKMFKQFRCQTCYTLTCKPKRKELNELRPTRISFEHLVDQNKEQLLNDEKALEKIEKQIDEKHARKSESLVN